MTRESLEPRFLIISITCSESSVMSQVLSMVKGTGARVEGKALREATDHGSVEIMMLMLGRCWCSCWCSCWCWSFERFEITHTSIKGIVWCNFYEIGSFWQLWWQISLIDTSRHHFVRKLTFFRLATHQLRKWNSDERFLLKTCLRQPFVRRWNVFSVNIICILD